jgi:hypothetical protein
LQPFSKEKIFQSISDNISGLSTFYSVIVVMVVAPGLKVIKLFFFVIETPDNYTSVCTLQNLSI